MLDSAKPAYRFGPFAVDTTRRLLFRGEQTVSLTPKAFDILLALVQHPGEVLDKDELMTAVWPGQALEDANLTVNMSALRKALGERPHEHRYIATVPGRGYKFVATLSTSVEIDQAGASNRHSVDSDGTADTDRVARRSSRWFWSAFARPRLAPVAALLMAIAASCAWWLFKPAQSAADAHIRSIAVLPFRPLIETAGDPSLELGLTEMLTTRLSKIDGLVVRLATSFRGSAESEYNARAAGRELNVESVLIGRIQHAGDRIRITVRLIRVRDESALWAEHFDEPFTDLLKIEDSISERIAGALSLELTGDERQQLTRHATENAEAYRLYLLGRFHWSKTNADGWTKSIEHFDQAVSLDPNYALAYTGLADAYLSIAADDSPASTAGLRAKSAATKAVALDDTLAEAHVSLGRVKAYHDWDWDGAGHEFRRALDLSPNSADARREYGLYLAAIGRHDEAVAQARRALQLEPASLFTNFAVGWALISARRYDETIEHCYKSLEIDGQFAGAPHFIGLAYVGKSMWGEAVAEFQKALSLSPDSVLYRAQLGFALARAGRTREAETVLAELSATTRERYVSPYYSALVLAGLNRTDEAFARLEQAYRDRSRRLWALKVVPTWDPLRSDERFARLLQRIGLPE